MTHAPLTLLHHLTFNLRLSLNAGQRAVALLPPGAERDVVARAVVLMGDVVEAVGRECDGGTG